MLNVSAITGPSQCSICIGSDRDQATQQSCTESPTMHGTKLNLILTNRNQSSSAHINVLKGGWTLLGCIRTKSKHDVERHCPFITNQAIAHL